MEQTNLKAKRQSEPPGGFNMTLNPTREASVPISRAKNILDLNNRFSDIYEQSSSVLTKDQTSTYAFNDKMERKLDNIMQRLKCRFDRETHRANNEKLV